MNTTRGRTTRLGKRKTSIWDDTPKDQHESNMSPSMKLPPLLPRRGLPEEDFVHDPHRATRSIDSSNCIPPSGLTTPARSPELFAPSLPDSSPPSARSGRSTPLRKRVSLERRASSCASTATGSVLPSVSPSPSPIRDTPSPALRLSRLMKRQLELSRPASPSSNGLSKTDIQMSQLLQRRLGEVHAEKSLVVRTGTSLKKIINLLEEEKIFDLYEWRKVLQESGDGGKVVVCRPKSDKAKSDLLEGEEYILKMCSKEHLRTEKVEEQFRHVLQRLLNLPSHPGVLVPEKVHEDGSYYYIVMKKAEGGSLFESFLAQFSDGVIPGGVVKSAMRQLLKAVGHVHSNGLLHRDIKPDNIVVHNDAVMLIDFDHADPEWDPENPKNSSTFYGTFRFSAPEVFLGEYSQRSDLYSVGCSLYLLMTGKFPRDDDLFKPCFDRSIRRWRQVVFQNLEDAPEVDWTCDPWPSLPACKDLCQSLLQFDPMNRPSSVEEALRHAWFEDDSA